MAYQKLNTSKAWSVTPSDNAPIPQIMVKDGGGTVTAQTATTVTDNLVDFDKLGVKIGMILVNTTTNASAIINGLQGATKVKDTLRVNANVFVVGNEYQIYGGQNNGCLLYVGGAGNVEVKTAGGDKVNFSNVAEGFVLPVNVIQVFATDTTATNIVALW
jgi:hypothetical protein